MKIFSHFLVTVCFCATAMAQVGIGTTTPGASLDIKAVDPSAAAATDGILIPRIDAFPATDPTAAQNSMIVYLTTTDGSSAPGFYFWNHAATSWSPLGGTASDDWTLTGNTGTTSGTNFIGTTDAQALDIRTNNVIRARFTTSGQLEILNTGQSVIIGEGAGAAHDNSGTRRNTLIGFEAGNDITTAVNNTVIGWRAMDAATDNNVNNNVAVGQSTLGNLTSGALNVAMGTSALGSTSTASHSVAVGQNALSNSIASQNNVAIGQAAGANADGGNNVFVGKGADAFNNNSGATRNVIIGSEAGDNGGNIGDDMSGRIMIGYQAGNSDGNSNRLYIENSNSTTPLLYGEFDNNVLRVGGQLQIGSSDDTTAGTIYAFPTVDGTNGQVLTTDGSGNVTWQTASGSGADTQDLSIDNTTADLSLVDGGTVEIKTIADSDDDTLIQVEESADEDMIRFDIEGVEHFTMDTNGRLQVFNTGRSVFVGEGAGANDDLTTNRNTFVGYQSGQANSSGFNNTAIGYQTLLSVTSGERNLALGNNAGDAIQTGDDNVAIGASALGRLSTNSDNVAVGASSMANTTTGERNVAVGRTSGANSDGDDNVYIGFEADAFNNNTGATRNVILGSQAGDHGGSVGDDLSGRIMIGYQAGNLEANDDRLYIENSNSSTPLIGGDFSTDRVGINTTVSSLNHTLTVGGSVKINTLMNLNPSTAPASPDRGDVYYDDATNKVRVWTGSAWEDLN